MVKINFLKKSFFSNLNDKEIAKNILKVVFIFEAAFFQCEKAYSKKTYSVSHAPVNNNQSIKGRAAIIDGDTIIISTLKIRLLGIDAPELRQFCGIKKAKYACGLEAKEYLKKLIANKPVTCYWDKKDKYQRVLATCQTKKVDNINAAMVRDGWAVSYYDYFKEEQEAKKKKNGIWRSKFQQPREWRRAHLKK